METARAKDTGTLQYEIYFRDDQSLGRDWSPANSLVRRAPSSERRWLTAQSVSDRRVHDFAGGVRWL